MAELDLYRLHRSHLMERHRLREMAYTNTVVIAALLEGVLLNLSMMAELEKLKKEIEASGGRVTNRQIRYPRR